MAQHDYIISNASGAAVRADLNSALLAIASQNSGATAPSATYAYMPWADTTAGLLKFRNAANTDWVTVGTLASVNLGLLPAPGSAGTADQVLGTNGSGVQSWVTRARMVLDTAKASTSGTAVEFPDIPSWANKITMSLRTVSTNGSAIPQVQLGTSGGYATSGYASMAMAVAGVSAAAAAASTGLVMSTGGAAANSYNGLVHIVRVDATNWAMSSIVSGASNGGASAAGSVTLGGQLDRVRLTTTGADTFDAGSVNILYEG